MALFSLSFSPSVLAICLFMCCVFVANSQYYGPPMGGAIGCVVTLIALIRSLTALACLPVSEVKRDFLVLVAAINEKISCGNIAEEFLSNIKDIKSIPADKLRRPCFSLQPARWGTFQQLLLADKLYDKNMILFQPKKGTKLFSHGNYIRDLNAEEFQELDKYRRELIEFKEKVDAAYANIDVLMQKNGTLPVIPNRPLMPAFCASNQTTLYILGGCTVQNHKVYIGGKFARDLTEKEKNQLDLFSKQMVAANAAAAQLAAAAAGAINSTNPAAAAMPFTTTVSPVTDAGRQIALDFCTEF